MGLRVTFVGTGEAFDGDRVNTSVLVEGARRLLLDCGPTVPAALWRLEHDPDLPDAVYISHFHGDHMLGLPFLLGRLHTDGRRRPLVIFGGEGVGARVEEATRLAYPSLWGKLGYSVETREVAPGRETIWEGFVLSVAESRHAVRNLALRLSVDGLVVCYSGDGASTPATRTLFQGADLLIHEAFVEREAPENHASVEEVVALAEKADVARVALVHVERGARVNLDVARWTTGGMDCVAPADGDTLELSRSTVRS